MTKVPSLCCTVLFAVHFGFCEYLSLSYVYLLKNVNHLTFLGIGVWCLGSLSTHSQSEAHFVTHGQEAWGGLLDFGIASLFQKQRKLWTGLKQNSGWIQFVKWDWTTWQLLSREVKRELRHHNQAFGLSTAQTLAIGVWNQTSSLNYQTNKLGRFLVVFRNATEKVRKPQ